MSGPSRPRGPRPLSEILGTLMEARGLGRQRARRELEAAWAAAVGESTAQRSRIAGLRHGVLTVTVAHPALLEELAAFRKPQVLEALRQALPTTPIRDLRFRVGPLA